MSQSHWVLDVNALINCYLADSPAHRLCTDWLGEALGDATNIIWLPTLTKAGFVRILGSGFATPDPIPLEALHDYLSTLEQLGAQEAFCTKGHSAQWRRTCAVINSKANDITDSHIAATALELNATLVTYDKGFKRFIGLKTFDPSSKLTQEVQQ